MSSPSPGKRRMDTDVVKLYPFQNINNKLEETNQMFYNDCQLLNVGQLKYLFPMAAIMMYVASS